MSKKPRQMNQDVEAETLGAQVDDVPEHAQAVLSADQAAQVIVDLLDPDHKRILYECSRETGQPVLAYVLSALRLSRDRNEISKLDRESLVEPEAVALPATVRCQWCAKAFVPTRAGQYLCPDPPEGEESCARKQAKARQMERKRAMQGMNLEPTLES